jgi:hypothetical protein
MINNDKFKNAFKGITMNRKVIHDGHKHENHVGANIEGVEEKPKPQFVPSGPRFWLFFILLAVILYLVYRLIF